MALVWDDRNASRDGGSGRRPPLSLEAQVLLNIAREMSSQEDRSAYLEPGAWFRSHLESSATSCIAVLWELRRLIDDSSREPNERIGLLSILMDLTDNATDLNLKGATEGASAPVQEIPMVERIAWLALISKELARLSFVTSLPERQPGNWTVDHATELHLLLVGLSQLVTGDSNRAQTAVRPEFNEVRNSLARNIRWFLTALADDRGRADLGVPRVLPLETHTEFMLYRVVSELRLSETLDVLHGLRDSYHEALFRADPPQETDTFDVDPTVEDEEDPDFPESYEPPFEEREARYCQLLHTIRRCGGAGDDEKWLSIFKSITSRTWDTALVSATVAGIATCSDQVIEISIRDMLEGLDDQYYRVEPLPCVHLINMLGAAAWFKEDAIKGAEQLAAIVKRVCEPALNDSLADAGQEVFSHSDLLGKLGDYGDIETLQVSEVQRFQDAWDGLMRNVSDTPRDQSQP